MSQNKFDQFNDLVTRLAAVDGTLTEERSHELLDTELAHEVLEAIVGGLTVRQTDCSGNTNPYDKGPCGKYP